MTNIERWALIVCDDRDCPSYDQGRTYACDVDGHAARRVEYVRADAYRRAVDRIVAALTTPEVEVIKDHGAAFRRMTKAEVHELVSDALGGQ